MGFPHGTVVKNPSANAGDTDSIPDLVRSPIVRSTLDKNPMPGHHFEGNPVDESTSRRGTDTAVHCLEKTAGSTHSSTSGLSLLEQLERQAEFHSSTQDEA